MIFLAPYCYGRHGASQAPHAILAIRNGQGHYHPLIGEIPVHGASALDTAKNITSVLSSAERYVVLGGDHSITEGVLNARAKKSPVHLVLFDAHTDDYEDSSELQKHRPLHHGNWLARGLKSGAVSGVTMRDGNRDVAPRKYLKAVPRNKPVHLSIDLDVLSTNTIGMATSYPEAGGYSLDELLRELRLLNLQGRTDVTADLTEYDPTRDRNGVAGWCAATIVTELLSIIGS